MIPTQKPSAILLDTTEQNALGWTKYPDGGPQTRTPGWVEESFTNFERGINWRSFVVCDVAFNSVNNWLWTPFIERGEANRLYIEIKFTMRDCNLFPQMVLSCKETFALLYKEMDSPIQAQLQHNSAAASSNASFAQSDSYTLIDAIAADEGRFTSNTDVVINTEIRSIPVSKRGVYFAFRDQGACLSLISIKVYHTYCPQLVTAFSRFNATPTGREVTSLVAVEGNCVANSIQIEQPKMFCGADGQWNSMSSGQCKCLQGFEPANNQTKCQPCPLGKFKASLGELACQSCPEHSVAQFAGATECKCLEGFYRAGKDSRSSACTQPPGPPTNLTVTYVDSSSLILQWSAPKFQGGRDDLTYKLVCDSCDQTMVSSPQFYANFSETKCVLSGLSPATSYRFLVYAMNGVSQLALPAQSAQNSEISVQTGRALPQTTSNTLSSQTGLQLMPVFNFRALPGARGSDMLLAWEAQPLGASLGAVSLASSPSADQLDGADPLQLPSLYEIRFQPRFAATHQEFSRRMPYPASLMEPQADQVSPNGAGHSQQQQQTVTTTNRAVAINSLQPRTEYAFQIRVKWAHTNQWTEFSEPIYQSTISQMPPAFFQDSLVPFEPNLDPAQLQGAAASATNAQVGQRQSPFLLSASQQQQQPGGVQSGYTWLGTSLMVLLCALIALAVVSVGLVHYRKSFCIEQLAGAGFGNFSGGGSGGAGSSSTYGGVYGGATGSLVGPLGGFGSFGNPLGIHSHLEHIGQLHNHHQHHHATLSASSAGGLITGSNATSRSSSGAGNVVQNFIAATLNQLSGGHHNNNHHHHHHHTLNHTLNQQQHSAAKTSIVSHLNMNGNSVNASGAPMGKQLFGQPASTTVQRNHYHQTLNHTMLLGNNQGHFQQSPLTTNLQQHSPQTLTQHQLLGNQQSQQQQCVGQPQSAAAADLLKYRTFNHSGAQYGINHQDPVMHIYDDLDAASCPSIQRSSSNEIEVQRISIESVIGKGEFGDICLAKLRSAIGNSERRVVVKTLKAQANERAKLDFLVEASIMSQFDHPNIIRLEGFVTKSEPPMIVTEYMEKGALDSYLRDNKNRFTCSQLISMLRGIANGMQYLAKLNYVHKDLAARNILVDGQNVCKIANFSLSANQLTGNSSAATKSGDYANGADSSSTDSSNTLSSQTTGGTPTTSSTMTGSGNLCQLLGAAEQIAQQRFAAQQQPLSSELEQNNLKIPVRWTALETIAYKRFTSASDVWSFGVVCWEVMTQGERPYWNWSNQDVIKAVEQGYRLPQPENCPEQLYKMMLDCWLKDKAARPTFSHIVRALDRLLSPYDDPFCQQQPQQQQQPTAQLVPMQTRISTNLQEPAYYDTYNPISQLISNNKPDQQQPQSVDEWLSSIKMNKYRENFQRHQINTLQYVARLGQADLNLIGIQNNQHIKKILNAITALRSTSSIGPPGEGYLV